MPRPHLLVAPLAALLLVAPVGVAGAQQAPNQPPTPAPDEATVAAGQSVTVPVLANDSDDGLGRPEGEPPRLHRLLVARARALALGFDDPEAGATAYAAATADLAAAGLRMADPIELPRF